MALGGNMTFITRLLWFLQPLTMFIDKNFTINSTVKKVTGDHYYMWRDQIRIGYVFLTSASGHGSNIINRGKYKHGAIYFGRGLKTRLKDKLQDAVVAGDGELAGRLRKFVDDESIRDDIYYVIESVGEGVVVTNLVKFLTTKDHVKIMKPLFADNSQRQRASNVALDSLGIPYDYGFTTSNKEKYCFELVALSYEEATDVILNKAMYKFLGKSLHMAFVSDTFCDDPDRWACVIDSDDSTLSH